jgi:hypothetical protein
MLKAIKPLRNLNDTNSLHNLQSTKKIKITYNDGKCYICNKDNNLSAITNDGGSLSYCNTCNKQILIFEYVDENNYEDRINNQKAVITYYK